MSTPIIIPINNTRKVNCIIEGGVRYCEDNPISRKEGGIIALSLVALILWFMFWIWLSEKTEKIGICIFCSIVLPLAIFGIMALL